MAHGKWWRGRVGLCRMHLPRLSPTHVLSDLDMSVVTDTVPGFMGVGQSRGGE